MVVFNFREEGLVNGRPDSKWPHGFYETPFKIGRKEVVLTYAARGGGVDKYDLVPSADVGDNACVGYVTFLASLRYEKEPVTGFNFGYAAHFLSEFGLLPRNAGHFNAHFGIYLADQAGAVDTVFVVAARAVGCAGVSTRDLHDLRDVRCIDRAGAGVGRGGASRGRWFSGGSFCHRFASRRPAGRRSASP